MKFLDVPPFRKAAGIAVVAVVAVVVAQGLGLIGPPAAFVAGLTGQIKNLFTKKTGA